MALKKSVQEMELENRIPIEDYFNRYVTPLKKGIREISKHQPTSICPFHDENDPSMHYWEGRKLIHCFGCGITANIVRLHQLVQKQYYNRYLDKAEAINELIRLYGLQGVLKDAIATQEEPVNVFDRARNKIEETMSFVVPADTITIAKFRKLNDNIKNSNMHDVAKEREFANIDMLLSLVMSGVVEN